MATFYPAGGTNYSLNASIGSTDTSITLVSFTEPVSNTPYTMAYFNSSVMFGTIAPRTTSSEFISFTGITQNADGTATLTGVTRGLQKAYPYTTSATFKLPHSGQSVFILSDAPQVFDKYASLDNDETFNGLITFIQPPIGINPGGQPNASTVIQGVVQEATVTQVNNGSPTGSTGAVLFASPADLAASIYGLQLPTSGQKAALVGNNGSPGSSNTIVTQTGLQIGAETYAVTTGAANTYEVALTPVPIALTAGMALRLKSNFANTGAALLSLTGVNGATVGTFTVTIATPGVFTLNSHGLVAGDIVKFTTSGALPTGLTVGTKYYVISGGLSTNAFEVSTTLGGSAVNTTGSQSGTHTCVRQTANITKLGTTSLVSGDIGNAQEIIVTFDGTQWQLQNPVANVPFANLFKNGTTTKDSSDSSTTQNIAHGLGLVPKFVRITARSGPTGTGSGAVAVTYMSQTVYNGTTQSSNSNYLNAAGSISFDTTFSLNSTNGSASAQVGVVTFDATNIIITWTKNSTPTGTYTLLWEAYA